jgi:hypothetical protein
MKGPHREMRAFLTLGFAFAAGRATFSMNWGFIANYEQRTFQATKKQRRKLMGTFTRFYGFRLKDEPRKEITAYFELVISTTSAPLCPRARASWVPSGDQAALNMLPDLKLVICLAGPPFRGCLRRLETASRVMTKSRACSSGAHEKSLASPGASAEVTWCPEPESMTRATQ